MSLTEKQYKKKSIPTDLRESLRWNEVLRFRLIEIITFWEGRLTTNHLCDAYNIGRQQASKTIKQYNKITSDNLQYDTKLKGYCASETFQPLFTEGTANEYLELLHQNQCITYSFQQFGIHSANTHIVKPTVRSIEPKILSKIIAAINNQDSIEVDYLSISSPDREGRLISPHSLVYNGSRWHVRAYCEKNGEFRDFVLSRFKNIETEGKSSHTKDDDDLWNTPVTIKLAPDRRLSKGQKEVLIGEYNMQDGQLHIDTTGALAHYMLRELRVEPRANPTEQQLEIVNFQEIEPYLFSSK